MDAQLPRRFPIRFDRLYSVLSSMLLMPPAQSYVEVAGSEVTVRMSWGFRSVFPKSSVRAVSRLEKNPISRGVHGYAGKWLVNGSGNGIVTLDLEPVQRARVMGFPVKLRQLMISVEQPEQLQTLLQGSAMPLSGSMP